MNTENLSKCLQTLRHMYDDLARKNVHCDTEPEFRAYDILLNLADSNVLSMTHTYRKSVRGSSTFKLAAELACSFHTDNYVAFFKLIREKANYLQACLCRAYFSQIRVKALNTMVKIAKPTKVDSIHLLIQPMYSDSNFEVRQIAGIRQRRGYPFVHETFEYVSRHQRYGLFRQRLSRGRIGSSKSQPRVPNSRE